MLNTVPDVPIVTSAFFGPGTVRAYPATGWVFDKKFVGTGLNGRLAGDQFGSAVAISSNGMIAVGAAGQAYDENGQNAVP